MTKAILELWGGGPQAGGLRGSGQWGWSLGLPQGG